MPPVIVGLGEILWDLLPGGRQLGGAPANFAYFVKQFGCDARVVTAVGNDGDGRDILAYLLAQHLPTDGVAVVDDAPTGIVTVALDDRGVPTYTIHEPAAWDCIPSVASLEIAAGADVVCFGTLAQRQAQSREAIHTFLEHTPADAWRVLDVNFRLGIYTAEIIEQSLTAANVLKINDDELEILRTFYELPAGEEAALRALAERFELHVAVLTRGAAGSLAISGAASSEQPVIATDIVDTVGAGDAFGAAFVVALKAGQPLDDAHALAAQVAAFVCSQSGAMSPLPKEVLRQWDCRAPRA